MNALQLLYVGSIIEAALCCYDCFFQGETNVCEGYYVEPYNFSFQPQDCEDLLTRTFKDTRVIEAARVARGFSPKLKEILLPGITAISNADEKSDIKVKKMLENIVENFIKKTQELNTSSSCFPPCGFQENGGTYNCSICYYDSCDLPIDCPVIELKVEEKSRTEMWCNVSFPLPQNAEMVWKYAIEYTTMMSWFTEVTAGNDSHYVIPSARLEHAGTYQCEILSKEGPIARIYFYLTVVSAQTDQAELQNVFEQALLPGGQFSSITPVGPDSFWLPSPFLLSFCLTTTLLFIFLTIVALYWLGTHEKKPDLPEEPENRRFLIHY